MIRKIRTQLFYGLIGLSALLVVLGQWMPGFRWALLATLPLVILGLWDLLQTRHNLLRNYPIVGHLRYLIEDTGAELRQYIVESNTEGKPFNRDQRSLMYQRAKGVSDKKPFGTELNVYAEGYTWMTHSMAPRPVAECPVESFRIQVGGDACRQPYSASIYNISAMSFGSLSGSAIRALNKGAKLGDFAHNTGEGGVSRYHEEFGGDLIWQIGTGYFGCRSGDGDFDPDRFAAQATRQQIRMIEIKISQGAKPGLGGILPAVKITREIAEARGVPLGADCVSPAYHRAFGTPTGLLEFTARLRELSGGKPVGFKLCVGRPDEFFAVCKAMIETGLAPDFITIDGAEGGTGAAPIEFSDHIGLPAREGILLVHNALVGIDMRDSIRIIAAGKLISGFEIAVAFWRSGPTCATRRAASCSRWAASRRRPATPTSAPWASPPSDARCSGRWWSPTSPSVSGTSTARPSRRWRRSLPRRGWMTRASSRRATSSSEPVLPRSSPSTSSTPSTSPASSWTTGPALGCSGSGTSPTRRDSDRSRNRTSGWHARSCREYFSEWREQKRGSCVLTLDNRDKMSIFSPFQYPERERFMAIEHGYPAWSSSSDRSRCAADDRFDPTGLNIMVPGAAGAVM